MSLGREKRDSDVFNTSYRPGRNRGIGITTEGGWIHLNRKQLSHSHFYLPSQWWTTLEGNTVELQWLQHLWDHGNMFETGVVRANER